MGALCPSCTPPPGRHLHTDGELLGDGFDEHCQSSRGPSKPFVCHAVRLYRHSMPSVYTEFFKVGMPKMTS